METKEFTGCPYEFKFWLRCEFKPFTETKHKCLRCRECTPSQFFFCRGIKWGRMYAKKSAEIIGEKKHD